MLKKIVGLLPGIATALVIAAVAQFAAESLPIHLISASVIALFLGMIINAIKKPGKVLSPGVRFTSKRLLKFAIILLGASLNIATILQVGSMSLFVMTFTLLTCFGGGYFVGKALGLNWKLSNLISAGTGICGGSAIAAIAPAIDADDRDIAYAMSATFLFDMVMIVAFPFLGRLMNQSDVVYGLWAGTAVNDTSSVVAAGYAFSEAAGDFAVMVKLTRTLAIIPCVIIFTLINLNIERKKHQAQGGEAVAAKWNLRSIIPWFILGFIGMSLIRTANVLPVSFCNSLKEISKFLMVAALGAIGLNTSFSEMKKSGFAPMLHGFIISLLVVIVALAVILLEQKIGMTVH